jgi:signal transduction histidine kinase/ActR/RegA family two-component response regulator
MKGPLPPDEPARLASLRALGILDSLPETQFDEIVAFASALCETPIALIGLIDETRQWYKARVGIEATETPREITFCTHALLQRELLVVPDATRDPRFADNPSVTDGGVRFYAGAPLLSPDGYALGTLCVVDVHPRTLSPLQARGLALLSSQITRLLALRAKTAALEETNARLVEREATIARDISEAKKVERIKNEFVATVSHELRTPLTSIRGALGLLEGGILGALDEATLEIVRIARTNSDRLIRLVNDMLDLQKIEAGKLELAWREATVRSLVDTSVDSVRGMAEEAGVTIRVGAIADLYVKVDVDRMVQVLTNLLSNAAKFSPRGGEVVVRAVAAESRIRLEVVDRGPGIAPELLPRLFQKFQQLDASDKRAKGGTGLGLAISRAIVEELGGTIGVSSSAGEGSTFWIEIARIEPSRALRVLIVDDDAELRAEVADILIGIGADVREAADGAIALHFARTESPDLILLDLGIPRPNGFEVVAILREEIARDTPLIVFTGRPLTSDDRAALKLGETRYLLKSRADEATIVRTVRELVGDQRLPLNRPSPP